MEKIEVAKFEREIIQDIIHKQQDIRYKNYGWSVALVMAISVASISADSSVPSYLYLCLGIGIILMFGIFDVVHRSDFYKIADRSYKVEEQMRVNMSEYDGPRIEETLMDRGLDKRTFRDIRFWAHYTLLCSICIGVFIYMHFYKS